MHEIPYKISFVEINRILRCWCAQRKK